MTEWILSSSILILVVIGLRTVLKGKISLRLQYALWGLVLLRLLIPVNFGSSNISVANLTEVPVREPVPIISATTDLTPPERIPDEMLDHVFVEQGNPVDIHADDTLDVTAVLENAAPIIWAIGFLSVAALFLITNARFKRKILDSRYSLGLRKNNLDVYATVEIDTPCLFGLKNPAIYVTYPVADDPTLLRHTLEHEATHYRHGDHIWAVLRCVCLAIHWYNPLVWWAAFLSRQDGELACDEATIRRLGEGERAEYGRTLIGMTCQKKANVLITATTMNSGRHSLRERILLIARKPKMAVYTLIAVVLIAAVAVGCTFTGARDASTDDLTGTKVFSNPSEVTGMAIHALPDAYTLVDSAYLSNMAEWALSFEYGDIIDSNAVMDPGSNTFSVTLYYADGTEQTAYLDYETADGITYRIDRQDVPDCWHDIWADDDTAETEPLETELPDDAPPVNIPEMLHEQPDPDKICIGVQPTGLSTSCYDLYYIIPENQELLLEYYQAAVARGTELSWDSNAKMAGWYILYQGEEWQVFDDGSLRGEMSIAEADAKDLYEFCKDAIQEVGIGDPVRPEDITGIISATLYWNGGNTVMDPNLLKGAVIVTDPFVLGRLETLLTNSRYQGSVQCPFTARLELTLENGKTILLAMSTDSCASWMSEGVAYGYGVQSNVGIEGNEEFYSFFLADIIHEKAQEGPEALAQYWPYVNWGLYSRKYSIDETFALMDIFKAYVLSNPTDWMICVALSTPRGLDGAFAEYYAYVVGEIFEAAPATFNFACRQMVPEQYVEKAVNDLAYYWGITPEEARARLDAAKTD